MINSIIGIRGGGNPMSEMSPFQPHWDLYPKVYVAPKISYPLIDNLDGDLSKEIWKNIPFSDLFDDIRGKKDAPSDSRPTLACKTRFKAVWDDTHMYIGAILESDFETQAHFHKHNSPIFQKDSDFEVFVDPFGSNHHYKELEVNAINTVWNLMLNKPYDDGGEEYSGRIAKPGDEKYFEVYRQKTATKIVRGRLNDENGSATWSIEVALSYKDLLAHTEQDNDGNFTTPNTGDAMRINFSRVEKQGEINWTWQPQIVWDPENHRYSGFVQMHLPDAWGYMVFGDEQQSIDGENKVPRDPSWPGRLAAMNVYYAQKHYKNKHKRYADSIEELQDLLDDAIVRPFHINVDVVDDGYCSIVAGNPDRSVVTITSDRHVRVIHPSEESAEKDNVTIN